MDLTAMHKRVIALDVHQARITACAVVEHDGGQVEVTKREFGAFKRDRRALAQWSLQFVPEVVVMESTGCTGRARSRHWRRWGQSLGWSTRVTSRRCLVARPTWPTRSGWSRWHARVCCAPRSSRRWSFASFGWWRASASGTWASAARRRTGCTRCWWTRIGADMGVFMPKPTAATRSLHSHSNLAPRPASGQALARQRRGVFHVDCQILEAVNSDKRASFKSDKYP